MGVLRQLANEEALRRLPMTDAPDAAPTTRLTGRRIGIAVLVVWTVAAMVGIGSLGLGHMVALPTPDGTTRLAQAALRFKRDSAKPLYVHVIAAGCSCTDRLFAHLVGRDPFPGVEEIIVFVGDAGAKQRAADRAGVPFRTISAADLTARFGLESAPVLIAFDAEGRLQYAGGYYDHPATISPRDGRIHAQLASGGAATPLPVFGCAVSAGLKRSIDPLGVVY
jgi:hypothetical protein